VSVSDRSNVPTKMVGLSGDSLRMTPQHFLFIVNPHSGKRGGLAVLEAVRPVFDTADAELMVQVTERPGHARELAREFVAAEFDGVCVVGGDGTVHEVIGGLMERGEPGAVPLGVIPGGTGNDVSRHLGCKSSFEFAERIVAGQSQPFDVARVEANGLVDYATTLVGWVGVADVNARAERLRALGPCRYALATVRQILFPRRCQATLVLDGERIDDEFMLVVACNTAYSGGGMRLAPSALTDDGKLDVIVIRQASRWQLLRTFARVYHGTHIELPWVECYQVSSLSIVADDCRPLDIDGEVKGSTPVEITVLPGAVRVFC